MLVGLISTAGSSPITLPAPSLKELKKKRTGLCIALETYLVLKHTLRNDAVEACLERCSGTPGVL
jgi:hypothetical protein